MDATAAIAVSGLNTAATRVEVSASNLANMDDSAPLPGSGIAGPAPFTPTRVAAVSLPSGGVKAQLSPARPGSVPSYQPDSPYADANGMVATPDDDPVADLMEQMQGLQQYRASAALIAADDKMQKTALNLLG